ncbi:CAMK family protein kinase [Histomonas meleagridis]|uniref:CAMK family protein kinase n=1 Tax=Histomonas meleagridis TaxID=135588 RepID=UPI00355A24E3|nr:CAMK family protein kinase [Histomonas meleagridis]KAH0799281.1 CAMK family protein kinase [Histomonas meleagridis]
MDIPIPDFDGFSDDQSVVSSLLGSIPGSPVFSFGLSCDPSKTFDSHTKNELSYDSFNPIHQAKTCTIYIAKDAFFFYVLKASTKQRLIKYEWKMYNSVGECPTIIKAYDSWDQEGMSFIQLEFAVGGPLFDLLPFIDRKNSWKLLAHISLAIHQVHSKGYIHLDISPSNILEVNGTFPKDPLFKLADFGTVIREGTFCQSNEGAGPYASPESIRFPTAGPVSFPTDIWSFGAVMYEAVTHKKMPRDFNGYDAIRNGTYDLSLIPDEFEIVRHMLNPNPNNRPTVNDLLMIPNVQQILSNLGEAVDTRRTPANMDDHVNLELRRRESFDDFVF